MVSNNNLHHYSKGGAACKAVWAFHAIAKGRRGPSVRREAGQGGGRADDDFVKNARDAADGLAKVAHAADARLTSVALQAAAWLASYLTGDNNNNGNKSNNGNNSSGAMSGAAVSALHGAVVQLVAKLAARAEAVAGDMDARGLSTTLW